MGTHNPEIKSRTFQQQPARRPQYKYFRKQFDIWTPLNFCMSLNICIPLTQQFYSQCIPQSNISQWGPVLFLFYFSIRWGSNPFVSDNKNESLKNEVKRERHVIYKPWYYSIPHTYSYVYGGDTYNHVTGTLCCNSKKQEVTHVSSDRIRDWRDKLWYHHTGWRTITQLWK